MARCGRCGLWNKYPDDHDEQKFAGVCLWYQHRLHDNEVFADRECPEFFERIPGQTPMDHYSYKVSRDQLGKAYTTALRSKHLAYLGIALSVLGLAWAVAKEFLG
jgi:hypothetical protein